MSRANEIVSMLTAGISIPRVLLPLIVLGFLTAAATFALNYELAPHADLARKNILSSERARRSTQMEGQIFRNRTDARTWFIQNFRLRQNVFNNVQILQQDILDNIVTSYLATRAVYYPETKTWQLDSAKVSFITTLPGTLSAKNSSRRSRSTLERDAISAQQRERSRRISQRAGAARVFAF